MNPFEDHIDDVQEEIINYLTGTMSDLEKSAFEEKIRQDDVLATELKQYTAFMEGIEHWGNAQLRSLVMQADRELEQEHFFEGLKPEHQLHPFVFLNKHRISLAIAASLALLVIAAYFLWIKKDASQELYSLYYKPEIQMTEQLLARLSPSGLIPSEPVADSLSRALLHYRKGEYSDALRLLEGLSVPESFEPTRLFYLAASHLALDHNALAQPFLKLLCNKETSEIQHASCWYLGLSLLKTEGRSASTEKCFRSISTNPDSPYSEQAKTLLSHWD